MTFWETIAVSAAAAFGLACAAAWLAWITVLPTIGLLWLFGVLK